MYKRQGIQDDLLAMHMQIEQMELVVEKKHPVESAGCEGEIVPVDVGEPRLAPEDPGKVIP